VVVEEAVNGFSDCGGISAILACEAPASDQHVDLDFPN